MTQNEVHHSYSVNPRELHVNKDMNKNEDIREGQDNKKEHNHIRTKVKDWYKKQGWSGNPFTFRIDPKLFVGYEEQCEQLLQTIEEKHKLAIVVGPTGSGKTTLLKWLCSNITNGFEYLYISKPPASASELVDIFYEKYPVSIFQRIWEVLNPNIKKIHKLPDMLNQRLKNKHLIVLCDEIHEANTDVLEWLRVLSDQTDNMTLILSGLPVFEETLSKKLESFQKRIVSRIGLLSLTKKYSEELIKKRIESVGGKGINPFTEDTIEFIFNRTGGMPREVLRMCNTLVNKAISKNIYAITKEFAEQIKKEPVKKEKAFSLDVLNTLTRRQNQIIKMLTEKDMTPGEIADRLNLSKYKTRQHAVRSMNNILQRLKDEGMIERKRKGRSFVYRITPKIKAMLAQT